MNTTLEILLKAVREHSGVDDSEIIQAGERGADAGWSGFTYYVDTCKFYAENQEAIWNLLSENAECQGVSVMELIASFGSASTVENEYTFQNLLAWFALEECGRYLAEQTTSDWPPTTRPESADIAGIVGKGGAQ